MDLNDFKPVNELNKCYYLNDNGDLITKKKKWIFVPKKYTQEGTPYYEIRNSATNYKNIRYIVGYLVAKYFKTTFTQGTIINYKDGNAKNCHVDNLICENDLDERWLQIYRFPEYYVSDYGRVKNIYRISNTSDYIGTLLSQFNRNGYKAVNLYYKKQQYRTTFVHRLVAFHFWGKTHQMNTRPDIVVNHEDFNRHNNYISNSSLSSIKNNTSHARKGKRLKFQSNSNHVKFDKNYVYQILYKYAVQNKTIKNIAQFFQCHNQTIRDVLDKQTYICYQFEDNLREQAFKKFQKQKEKHDKKFAKGTNNSKSKFTVKDILEIKRLRLEDGISGMKIAKIYNVDPSVIYDIFKQKRYSDITNFTTEELQKLEQVKWNKCLNK